MKIKTLRDLYTTIPTVKELSRIVSFKMGEHANNCFCYAGNMGSQYCTLQTRMLIEAISIPLWKRFPERVDRRLSIGDGCSFDGTTATGHASHASGTKVDFNYFTFKYNRTQYIPYWMDQSRSKEKGYSMFQKEIIHIWNNPQKGRSLIQGVFDWERNFFFFAWVIEALPTTTVLVSNGIKNVLRNQASKKYPELWNQIEKNIQGDDNPDWNHHLHCHTNFGSLDIPNGIEIDWDKKLSWLTTCKEI